MSKKARSVKIKKMESIITVLALFFVAMSFAGFYISSSLDLETLYLNLIKTLLVFDIVAMFVCDQLLRQERSKSKYLNEYTLMVRRR